MSAKKQPGAKKAAATSPAVLSPTGKRVPVVVEQDEVFLTYHMERLALKSAEKWAYDFKCPLPYYWWTFTYLGFGSSLRQV